MPTTAALRRVLLAGIAALIAVLLTAAAPPPPASASAPAPDPTSDVDPARLPAPARDLLPVINELTASRCPELPPLWVVAQVQAESGWDEGLTAAGPGGPAGLYQFGQLNWLAAGGPPWASDPPTAATPVTSGRAHLEVAVPWICANLRAVATHLAATGKPTPPLDAMLVCHLAGCGRVTGSATGVPAAEEAGCSARCAQVIARYLAAVHANLTLFAAPRPTPAAPPAPPGPVPGPADDRRTGPGPDPTVDDRRAGPRPWTGGATGCRSADPTSAGCLSGATRHGLLSAASTFGGWSSGPVIRSAGCWNEHAWNPRSDHPRGRACDLFAAAPGTFAGGAQLAAGWRLAEWLRAAAEALHVKYIIWQGRYWDPRVGDQSGWGRRYTGGGVYDVRNATGGHFDHVHVSFRE